MAYPAAVERWRSLVEKYFPASLVDKALHVIQWESSGQSIPQHGGGPGTGLFQIEHGGEHAGRLSQQELLDPETNVRTAAEMASKNWEQWTDWGEGVTYNGKPFGALGAHPFATPPMRTPESIRPPSSEARSESMAGKAPTPTQARILNEDGPPTGTDPAKTHWTDKKGGDRVGNAAKAAQEGWKFNATATQEANYDPEKPTTWTGDQRVNYLLGRGFTWSTKNNATAHGDTALWTAPNGEDYTEGTALVAPSNSPIFDPTKKVQPQRVTDDFGNIWEIDPSAEGGKRFITNLEQKASTGAQPAQGTTKVTNDGSVYYFPPYGGAPVNQGKYPELANKPNLQFQVSDITGTIIAIDPSGTEKPYDTGIKVGYPALSPDQKQAIDSANKIAEQRFATGERVAEQDFAAGQTASNQRFNAEQTASGQRFSAEQAASNQRFNAEQTASGQRFTAGESAADRAQHAAEFARSQGFLEQQAAAQQALEKAKFRADVLTKPSDYISAAFESRGFASPTDRITHADLINSADYYRNGNAPTAGGLRGFAGGGMTTEPRFMVGDSPTGMPTGNEEIIDNPTGAPVRVTPANNQVEGGSDSFKQTEEAFAKEIASHQGIWTKEEWAVAQAKRKALDAKKKHLETEMPQGEMPRFSLGTGRELSRLRQRGEPVNAQPVRPVTYISRSDTNNEDVVRALYAAKQWFNTQGLDFNIAPAERQDALGADQIDWAYPNPTNAEYISGYADERGSRGRARPNIGKAEGVPNPVVSAHELLHLSGMSKGHTVAGQTGLDNNPNDDYPPASAKDIMGASGIEDLSTLHIPEDIKQFVLDNGLILYPYEGNSSDKATSSRPKGRFRKLVDKIPRFALGTDYNPPVPGSSDWIKGQSGFNPYASSSGNYDGRFNNAGDFGLPPTSSVGLPATGTSITELPKLGNTGPLTLPNSTMPAVGTGIGSLPGGGGYYTGPNGAGTTGSPTAGGTFIHLQNILGLNPETAAKAAGFASVDEARASVDKNYISKAEAARMTALSGYELGGSRFGVTQAGLIDAARKFSPPAVSAALGGNRISTYRPATTGLTLQKLQQLTPEELQALSTRLGVEFNRSLSSEIAGLQSRFGDVVSRPRARLAL